MRPQLDEAGDGWRLPVVLTYAVVGPVGKVGEVLVLEAIGGTEESHAVVVVEASEETITVYDPLYGERHLSRQSFTTAWAGRGTTS